MTTYRREGDTVIITAAEFPRKEMLRLGLPFPKEDGKTGYNE